MKVYVDRNKLYEWFDPDGNGVVRIHVGDVDTLPLEDVAPVRHGRWEKRKDVIGFDRCSVCHDCNIYDDWADGKKWGYCPHCGAKMDLEGDNA